MKIDINSTENKYDIIYADPPWAYLWEKGATGGNFCPEKHYQTMEVSEICALGDIIKKNRAKNCALFIFLKLPNCVAHFFEPFVKMKSGSFVRCSKSGNIYSFII